MKEGENVMTEFEFTYEMYCVILVSFIIGVISGATIIAILAAFLCGAI